MSKKICLLIDDDVDDHEVFSMALDEVSSSTQLLKALSADEAFTILRKDGTLPDVIFLDLNMPKVDGYEFLVKIKREIKFKSVPVIIYSTSNQEIEIQKTQKLGASAFLSKTANFSELCQQLRKYFS